MNPEKISEDNRYFFCAAVATSMCKDNFASSVLHSFDVPVLYAIMNMFTGYIRIDSTDIKNGCSHGSFGEEVRIGILVEVARRLSRSVGGELNTEAEVVINEAYKFSFKISKYERDMEHGFEIVADPTLLPDDERLGRIVDLKITLVE